MKAIFAIFALLYSVVCFAGVSGTRPTVENASVEAVLSKAKASYFPAMNYFAVPANHPEVARVERIFARLQAIAGGEWHVYVLSNDPRNPAIIRDITAASLPGYIVALNVDFSKQLSDDGLAFALAHEMSHAVLNHVVERVVRLLSNAKEIPATLDTLPDSTPEDDVVFRNHEFEADDLGYRITKKAGFDAAAGIREALTQSQVVQDESASHPAVITRLQKLTY